MKNKKFRLFISSTFNDFKREREILQGEIFPEIKEYAAKRSYVFQAIDLRWGVNEEAQIDQKTLELCLDEVRECKKHIDPNFLIMLGDRYGWVPLPYAILKEEYEEIQEFIKTKEDKDELDKWYELDENQLEVSYLLKVRTGYFKNATRWNKKEEQLKKILQTAVEKSTLDEAQKRKYFTCAVEAEIEEGIVSFHKPTPFQKKIALETEETKNIFAFFRDIKEETKQGSKFFVDDSEDYTRAQNLKNTLKDTLEVKEDEEQENILLSSTTQVDEETLDENYLKKFKKKMTAFLKERIDAQKKRDEKHLATGLALEKEAQEDFLTQKRNNFLGQEVLLKKISTYIKDENTEPFLVYGRSGQGKSALLAEAIYRAKELPEAKIVYRFVGATPHSSRSQDILLSILEECNVEISLNEQESFKQFSQRALKALMGLEENLVIFIDAVDQLQNKDEFLWLPSVLPSNVKIIISALDDENYEDDSTYLKELLYKTKTIHAMSPFKEGEDLLLKLLAQDGRGVDKVQKEYFLEQYAKVESPLYVTIAAQEMKNYRSGDTTQELADTQAGVIEEYLYNLSSIYHHDEVFVQRVMSFLYFSKDGLSESELLQLLSSDKKFVDLMAPETYYTNINKELPVIHWARLHAYIKTFLNLKLQDKESLMYFFHREFEDVIRAQTYTSENYLLALESLTKLIEKNAKNDFEDNRWGKLYVTFLLNRGEMHEEKFLKKQLKALSELPYEWVYSLCVFLQTEGRDQTSYSNFKEAEDHFLILKLLLELLVKKEKAKWLFMYVETLNSFSELYYKRGKTQEGISLALEGLKELEDFDFSLDERFTSYEWNVVKWSTSTNLALLYEQDNQTEQALEINLEQLKTLKPMAEHFVEKDLSEVSMYVISSYIRCLNNISINYFTTAHKDESVFDENDEYTGNMSKELENSLRYATDGFSMLREIWEFSDETRWLYRLINVNMASTLQLIKEIENAIICGENAYLAISYLYEKEKDRYAHDYLDIHINLAYSYLQATDYDKSLYYCSKAYELVNKELKAENAFYYQSSFRRIYDTFIKNYAACGENELVMKFIYKDLEYILQFEEYASYLQLVDKHMQFLERTLSPQYLIILVQNIMPTIEKISQEDSLVLTKMCIEILVKYDYALYDKKEYKTALALEEKIDTMLEVTRVHADEYLTKKYFENRNNLGLSYKDLGFEERALEFEAQTFQMLTPYFERKDQEMMDLYFLCGNNFADSMMRLSFLEESVNLLQALSVDVQKYLGPNHNTTRRIETNLQVNSMKLQPKLEATFETLLYFSKYVAMARSKELIDVEEFATALGFIEFSEDAKSIFSQFLNLENIQTHTDVAKFLEVAKASETKFFDPDLKDLTDQLKDVFKDSIIGYIR